MSGRSDRFIQSAPTLSATATRSTRKGDVVAKAGLPGLPPRPEEMSWRDYLIMLLHIAAEIEHGLMVEYLYAAYSLGGEVAARHADQVRGWRDVILTVAREEMGHLITVQNLLLLIGGPVSFERQDYPWSSAATHLAVRSDELVRVGPLLKLERRWARHLAADPDDATVRALHRHETTGRPAGSARFLTRAEKQLGRVVRPQRPGRKKQSTRNEYVPRFGRTR